MSFIGTMFKGGIYFTELGGLYFTELNKIGMWISFSSFAFEGANF